MDARWTREMKRIRDAKKLHATLPIVATLGGVQRYRRLVSDPQQVRRWTRRGAIVPTMLVAYFSWGQAVRRHQGATGESTPKHFTPVGRDRHGRRARLLGLVRPIWACVLVELLIGKREKISHRRAILLALEPAVYVAVAQTLKSRESTALSRWSVPSNPRSDEGGPRSGSAHGG